MCSYYYYAVERSRRDYDEYLRTGKPEAYLSFVRYYDLDDMDDIPRIVEEDDINLNTTPYRVNYSSEVFVIGKEKQKFYPFE